MEVTVSSMFTTTPRRNPCEGQVPTPTIFSFPSRSSSPTRTQIFVVPTSIPTITRSCTIHAPMGGCQGVSGTPAHYSFSDYAVCFDTLVQVSLRCHSTIIQDHSCCFPYDFNV